MQAKNLIAEIDRQTAGEVQYHEISAAPVEHYCSRLNITFSMLLSSHHQRLMEASDHR